MTCLAVTTTYACRRSSISLCTGWPSLREHLVSSSISRKHSVFWIDFPLVFETLIAHSKISSTHIAVHSTLLLGTAPVPYVHMTILNLSWWSRVLARKFPQVVLTPMAATSSCNFVFATRTWSQVSASSSIQGCCGCDSSVMDVWRNHVLENAIFLPLAETGSGVPWGPITESGQETIYSAWAEYYWYFGAKFGRLVHPPSSPFPLLVHSVYLICGNAALWVVNIRAGVLYTIQCWHVVQLSLSP